ncbi:hypothetical protein CAPTEDRAFT_204218 [Capitella teleta]|uniref:Uncharacterized protein n=1 Tax=Capitella teleta TaxID=283909 RepID=R7T4T3_CAPTE|nr:hypothetical protein CAPTEDRAFT_204218 [Capitella teleta]|eukprot:ELT88102.1 hypothetical protein CAPTEDRAFT_204218 [Capitella teleta]
MAEKLTLAAVKKLLAEQTMALSKKLRLLKDEVNTLKKELCAVEEKLCQSSLVTQNLNADATPRSFADAIKTQRLMPFDAFLSKLDENRNSGCDELKGVPARHPRRHSVLPQVPERRCRCPAEVRRGFQEQTLTVFQFLGKLNDWLLHQPPVWSSCFSNQ